MISSMQENNLRPNLPVLDQVIVRSALGDYPQSLSYEFNSLWQLTDQEEATINNTNAQTLATLASVGVPEFTLLKDAIELGIVKNMTIADVVAMEEEEDFIPEDGNDDFIPDDKSEVE